MRWIFLAGASVVVQTDDNTSYRTQITIPSFRALPLPMLGPYKVTCYCARVPIPVPRSERRVLSVGVAVVVVGYADDNTTQYFD